MSILHKPAGEDFNITGTISRSSLETELGKLAQNALKHVAGNRRIIPNYENLMVGDVIMTRPLGRRAKKYRRIAQQQSATGHFEGEAATWSHAAIYVGRLHIAESQAFIVERGRLQIGTRIVPLTAYSKSSDLKICRHRKFVNGGEFRQAAARYAVLDCTVARRGYPFVRVVSTLRTLRFLRTKRPNFRDRIACSEFVLECLAVGGQVMINQFKQINDDPHSFYYPANFIQDGVFDKFDLDYLELET